MYMGADTETGGRKVGEWGCVMAVVPLARLLRSSQSASSGNFRRSIHRSGIGTVVRFGCHRSGRLPRLHRACPSAALDERVVNVSSTASVRRHVKAIPCLDTPASWQYWRMNTDTPAYTTPGLSLESARDIITTLDDRLVSLIDLALTLKHIHWNVVGPSFIGVHEMLDPQHASVQAMVDVLAERIATLGGSPNGTPGHVVDARRWEDYSIGRATTDAHLAALDLVYAGVIEDHRKAQEALGELDPVTEDILVGQIGELEQNHWFVRAHLENAAGELTSAGASTEKEAAKAAAG